MMGDQKLYIKKNLLEALKTLSGRMKELRKERKLRLKDMAEFWNVTLRHYRRMEKEEVTIPALTLCALADYFGVTTEYL